MAGKTILDIMSPDKREEAMIKVAGAPRKISYTMAFVAVGREVCGNMVWRSC